MYFDRLRVFNICIIFNIGDKMKRLNFNIKDRKVLTLGLCFMTKKLAAVRRSITAAKIIIAMRSPLE